jgi:hypothetical protein
MFKTGTELGGSYFFGVQAITKKEKEVLGCYLLNVVICLGCYSRMALWAKIRYFCAAFESNQSTHNIV